MKFSKTLLAPFLLAGCKQTQPKPSASTPSPKQDILVADMDTSVNPGDDFFRYANGGWLNRNPIPASEAAWGIGNLVREELYLQLRTINETAVHKKASPGTDEQKIGDFWTTAMNEAKGDELGLKPLKPELDRIDAIGTTEDAIRMAFALQRLGVHAFFDFGIAQDEKKSDEMAVHIQQGGLGLPDRDFYFNPEAGVAQIRRRYVSHIQNMLKLAGAGDEPAAAPAANIMEFETALAKVSRKLEDLRDPQSNYNKMTLADVRRKETPSIAWDDQLDAWNLHPSFVIVGQPEFFSGLEALLKKTPVPVLRDYLRFHLISEYAAYLSKEIDDEDFSFYHRVLSGQKEPRPRWKRVLDAEAHGMGIVLGRIFVKEYFPESVKNRYSALVEAIRTAYSERIDRLDWMSDATRTKAHQKLSAMT